MSQKRKRGLQSGLSEIVARQTAPLPDKSKESSGLIAKFREQPQESGSTLPVEKSNRQRTPRTARTPRTPPTSISPERDYTKVANSIVREAVAGGHFTGKSKQLYDFLYQRTRGAVVPVRSVRITKPKMMAGSSIGSERTLLKNLSHLKIIGLIKVDVTDGEHRGNEYTVFLPEEADLPDEPTPRTPRTPPTAADLRHAPQKVGTVPPVESGVRGVGLSVVESTTSETPKTSSLRPPATTDDDEAFALFAREFSKAVLETTGKNPSKADAVKWQEVADVLIAEMKIAAARTTVSSVPSFLAEHLRRRLWKMDKKQARAEGRELPDQTVTSAAPIEQAKDCPDCGGSGWWYPNGLEHGVARCKHARLNEAIKL
jgi:hypothetical protein